MTKIFFIRHAEAEGNIYRRAHGHLDGQIIGRGFLQIKQLELRFEHEKIDAVYSSDLSRTQDTAAAIYKPRGLRLSTDSRLREVNVGVWEDTAWGDLEYNESEMCGYFGFDPARWRVDGCEEYSSVIARMTDCLREIGERHEGGTVAVFSHGFAIRATISEIMGVKSHEVRKVPYCDNTAVTLLNYDKGELKIEYQGDNSHLSSDVSTFANQTWWRGEKAQHRENLRYMPLDAEHDAVLLSKAGGRFSCFTTAFLGDEPIGLVGLDISRESDEDTGWIDQIYLTPEHDQAEFAIQLIGQAVSEFRKLGRKRIKIEVPAEGQEFYLKYGFLSKGGSGGVCLMEKDITLKVMGIKGLVC